MSRAIGLRHPKVTMSDEIVRRCLLLNSRKLGPNEIVERMKDEGVSINRNTLTSWLYNKRRKHARSA